MRALICLFAFCVFAQYVSSQVACCSYNYWDGSCSEECPSQCVWAQSECPYMGETCVLAQKSWSPSCFETPCECEPQSWFGSVATGVVSLK